MPSASSSGKTVSYTAKSVRKTQQKFPIKRRYIRRNAPSLFPSSSDIQTTLTQCDFGVPSSNSREDSDILSDDELESSRPKKRVKMTTKFGKRDADQSTMTQFDRGLLPQLLKRSRSAGVGGGKMEVWEDDDSAGWGSEVETGRPQRRTTTVFLDGANEEMDHTEEPASEILETSPTRIDSSQWDERAPETRPADMHTPRKVRFTREVPSSQTPPSTKSSAPRSPPRRAWQTSPLKERSANIAARVTKSVSSESQNTTMKIFERIRFRSRNGPMMGGQVTNPSPQRVPSSQERAEASCSPPPLRPARTLRRVTTIQDSQWDEDNSLEATANRHANEPTPKMTRTVTVQDSQAEDFGLDDLYDINETSPTANDWDFYEATHTASDDLGPATYDPAYSALDRDAARFGQTQATQLHSDRFKEGVEDSETEDDDLDAIYVPRESRPQAGVATNADTVPLSLSSDTPRPKEASGPMPRTTTDASTLNDTQPPTGRTEPHLPSSPPALRPSQVSTVIPSQFSPIQPRSSKRKHSLPSSPPAKESTFPPTSPPESSALRCSPPSSPFLLPSAPTSSARRGMDDGDFAEIPTQVPEAVRRFELESLVDFSLPPPPPLSSSNRSLR